METTQDTTVNAVNGVNGVNANAVGMEGIEGRAMLVSMTISQWSGKIKDVPATARTAAREDASARAVEVLKYLFPTAEKGRSALKAIAKCTNAARQTHYRLTMPWTDEGIRLLPCKLYFEYIKEMTAARTAWQDALNEFYAQYDSLISAARPLLGIMFSESDYPSLNDVRAKFAFSWEFTPLPAASDFRQRLGGVPDDVKAALAKDAENRLRSQYEAAMQDAFRRLHALVEHMASRLRAYTQAPDGSVKNPFRDSLVSNISELIDILPGLNIMNSPDLARITEAARTLTQHDPETLRMSPDVRKDTAARAAEIMSQMKAFMVG